MNSTITDKLFDIRDFRKYSPIYIESGSCHGGSIERAMRANFEIYKSVEAYPEFYKICRDKFDRYDNIFLYLGESPKRFPDMLENVSEPAVIFLDAHPAGENTAGHDDLMEKGAASEFNQDTIITKELKAILQHRNDHTIVIDDQNFSNEDNLAYRQMLLEANPNYKFFWFDEKLNEEAIFYKNKILVCIA